MTGHSLGANLGSGLAPWIILNLGYPEDRFYTAMNDIDSFLGESVYYPCSALHGVPVKFLGKRFQRFFYATTQ